MSILLWLLIGSFVGAAARSVMPGPDPLGFLGSAILGAIGAGLGGGLTLLLADGVSNINDVRGTLMAANGALVCLLGYRAFAMRWPA